MSATLKLDDLRRAWETRDPALVRLVEQLAAQPEPPPKTPIREGALTFQKYLGEIRSYNFARKPPEEQQHYRIETMKALESPDAEVPLSDKLRLHQIIQVLWEDSSLFARTNLLKIIATVRLTYGPWRALKRIFKEAEAKNDTEVFGALVARFDAAYSGHGTSDIGKPTLAYLVRRGWRYLRQLGKALPAAYPDAAVDVLAQYQDSTNWQRTWVANHIFYHETRRYSRTSFSLYPQPKDLVEHRAYGDAWKRTPRPLFALLERARSEKAYEFATSALKTDFRSVLREIEPAWVVRLVNIPSKTLHDFVIWILGNVPRFEQSAFRTLGLHDAVLRLFDSPSKDAKEYAAEYARTHARDLPVNELVRLVNSDNEKVRKLVLDLLQERDARKDVGLEAWGQLLETQHGHTLASKVISKSFGPSELTPEWFKQRLNTTNHQAFEFIKKLLLTVHPREKLGASYFSALVDSIPDPNNWQSRNLATFALEQLAKFDLDSLDRDFLRRVFLGPLSYNLIAWINQGKLKAKTLGAGFLKSVAFHPDFESDPWLAALRSGPFTWAKNLSFNQNLSDQVLPWLRDLRNFSTAELSFEWLMKLARRSEQNYHEFAVDLMIKAFVPADFAPSTTAKAASTETAPTQADLQKATFVFTGKLATMTRDEAKEKVQGANGVFLGSVSAKLHYLVIGDEGSPLLGQGEKSSKHEKAEELNEKGANIKIISETAFLQMLAGQQKTHDADATLAGCQRLWQMAIAPGTDDAPLAAFARKYIRYHHPDIALAKTDRPVDPGAEIPQSFLTFELVKPLFTESRKPLREFALDLSRYEFARWEPPVETLIKFCESPYGDVRKFVADALLADDSPEHKKYRIDPERSSPAAIYSFCESLDPETRTLGMELIRRSPRLQIPEELFRLTESPDRKVRGFVIKQLWSLYHDRGIKPDWKPNVPPQTTVTKAARKAAETAAENRGPGVPHKPEQLPAGNLELGAFLRRILFEIPPGRDPAKKVEEGETEGITVKLKPLPARKAKLALIEVLRDLALADATLAGGLLPLLDEFQATRGASEEAACLVARTRIRHRFPQLQESAT